MTKHSGTRGYPICDGNSILLGFDEMPNYIFVGHSEYTFRNPGDNIIKFTSNEANNCVPYTVAYFRKKYNLFDGKSIYTI